MKKIQKLALTCTAFFALTGISAVLPEHPLLRAPLVYAADSDTILYNLVPRGKDYTAAADNMTGNNSVEAEPNEALTIDWTVRNDQGTAGIQMALDFSQVTYSKATLGDAYEALPTFNDKTDVKGEIIYTVGQDEEETAADNAVIYSFSINAPVSGTASIGEKIDSNELNKVVSKYGMDYTYIFHGLDIVVPENVPGLITGSGWSFEEGTGTLTITADDAVPSEYNNLPIKKAVIADGVTSIGPAAFRSCKDLTSITIPDSVTSIGDYAFYGCSSLKTIRGYTDSFARQYARDNGYLFDAIDSENQQEAEIIDSGTCGESVTWTFDDTFTLTISGSGNMGTYSSGNTNGEYRTTAPYKAYSRKIQKVVIGKGVTSIGSSAFYNCSNLTSVTLPEGVTSIGGAAFYTCKNLKDITIPDSVTSIDTYTFYGCRSLTSVIIPDSVTRIGECAFSRCSSLTSVIIPNSVTYISQHAFRGCTSLTDITIPDSVTYIGNYTFSGCSSLTSITIPDSVANISSYAFKECSSLKTIRGYTGSNAEKFANDNGYQFEAIDFWKFDEATGTLTISNLSKMPNYASAEETPWFAYQPQIRSIVFDSGVTYIGAYAFYGCDALEAIVIPEGVTRIGEFAFYGCTNVTEITLPEGLERIEKKAFQGTRITGISFPASLRWIGADAFRNCKQLRDIIIPEGVEHLRTEVFKNCVRLGSAVIADSVTYIGADAFMNCRQLDKLQGYNNPFAAEYAAENGLEYEQISRPAAQPDETGIADENGI